MSGARTTGGRWWLAALAALVALSAGLRLEGLDRLLPQLQEADANVVQQLEVHRRGRAGRERLPVAYYAYPTLLARALALLPEAEPPGDGTAPGERLEASLAAASADFVRTRAAVALLAILLTPLTWLLARRFLGPGPALLAAALVAISPLHLLFSQQARPHGAQATCALAAVVLALRMRARPGVASYLGAGLAAGLAVACLHNGAAALAPLAAAHLLRDRGRPAPRGFGWWGPLLLLVPAVLAYWMLYPSEPTLGADPGGSGSEMLEFGGHTMKLEQLDGSGLALVWNYLWDYEPGLLVAALAGLAFWVASRLAGGRGGSRAPGGAGATRADLLVVLAYALPYLGALGLMGRLTQDRFLLPLLPFLACLAAWPAARLGARPALALGWAALVLAFPAWVGFHFARLRATPDTIEQAAAWVREHVAPADADGAGRVLTTGRLTLPLFHSPESLRLGSEDGSTRRTVWLGWQLRHLPLEDAAPFDGGPRWHLLITPGKLLSMKQDRGPAEVEAWIEAADADYAVVEVSRLMAYIPTAALLREALARRGELVAEFRGEDPRWCTERPLDFQEVPDFTPRILAATAFGPCIEIYRLAR